MRSPALSLCLILVVVLAGCSGGGSQPVSLTFPSGSTEAIDNGQSVTITVTGVGTQGVTWSLTGPGSLSNQAATSVVYNASAAGAAVAARLTNGSPAIRLASSSTADPSAMVKATSVANRSVSATVTLGCGYLC